MKSIKKNKCIRLASLWMMHFADPLHMIRRITNVLRFFWDMMRYRRLPGAELIRLVYTWSQLHDRSRTTGIDAHYFYVNGWAMRRIIAQRPKQHVDIASQTMFVNLLSAVLPVTFVDYRPLQAHMDGLTRRGGDILNLSFTDDLAAKAPVIF